MDIDENISQNTKLDTEEKNVSFLHTVIRFIIDIFYNFVIILLIVVVIRSFIISPFHISGSSMTETLQNNDYIIIDKLSYRFKYPKPQDIIVFKPPNPRMRKVDNIQCLIAKAAQFTLKDSACELPDFFIKRVIGIPGDIIEIKDGEVFRNNVLLEEEYLDEENQHRTYIPEKIQYKRYEVPENMYFLMGDNRNGSSDSRSHSKEWRKPGNNEISPYVSINEIQGRYFLTLVSPKKIQGIFQRYFAKNEI